MITDEILEKIEIIYTEPDEGDAKLSAVQMSMLATKQLIRLCIILNEQVKDLQYGVEELWAANMRIKSECKYDIE